MTTPQHLAGDGLRHARCATCGVPGTAVEDDPEPVTCLSCQMRVANPFIDPQRPRRRHQAQQRLAATADAKKP